MTEAECTTRKWGNSLGIIIPREVVEKEHLHEDQSVMVDIKKKYTVKEFFGMIPNLKKSTEEMKKEMKKGWG